MEVIDQTPEQSISRLKLRLDEAARIDCARDEAFKEGEERGRREGRQQGQQEGRQQSWKQGRQEGRKEGRREGGLIGRIETLQEFLGVAEPTRDELATYEILQLTELAERLHDQLRSCGR